METDPRRIPDPREKRIRAVQLCAILAVFLIGIAYAVLSPGKPIESAGRVVVTREEYRGYSSFLSAFDAQHTYVYWDEKGIVNVYEKDGPFLYRLEVGHSQNGKGAIAVQDGRLYVKARGNIIYVFQGEQLIDWVIFSYEKWKSGDRTYETYDSVFSD